MNLALCGMSEGPPFASSPAAPHFLGRTMFHAQVVSLRQALRLLERCPQGGLVSVSYAAGRWQIGPS